MTGEDIVPEEEGIVGSFTKDAKGVGVWLSETFSTIFKSLPGAAAALGAGAIVFGVSNAIVGAESLFSLTGLFAAACAIGISTVVVPLAAKAGHEWWNGGKDAPEKSAALEVPQQQVAMAAPVVEIEVPTGLPPRSSERAIT